MSIRVVIMAKDSLFRGRIRARLETQRDIDVVGEFQGPWMACEIAGVDPDIICLSMDNPGSDILRSVVSTYPRACLIQIFHHLNKADVEEALKAGVAGYLLDTTVMEEITKATHAVMTRRHYSSPDITSWVVESYKQLRNLGTAGHQQHTGPESPGQHCGSRPAAGPHKK
jgi:DNA-binding NarL/FixJ family response regulator